MTAQEKYLEKNKDNEEFLSKRRVTTKKWSDANRDKMNKSQREWKLRNKDKVNAAKKRKRERDKLNPFLVMKRRLRNRTVKAFKVSRWSKTSGNIDMLGCSWEVAFNHLESKFTEGMNWENRHLWHIDHKMPLDSATTKEELIGLCHYTNLQPLWAEDNLRKSNKITSILGS